MKIRLILLLALVCYAWAIDPNEQTKAGEQDAKASKDGNGGKINANQKGGSRGGGSFSGGAKNKEAQGNNGQYKATALSEDKVEAKGNRGNFEVNKQGDKYVATGSRGDAEIDFSDRTGESEFKPVAKAGGSEVPATLKKPRGPWQGEATAKGKVYKFETKGNEEKPNEAVIYNNGQRAAIAQNLQNRNGIVIERDFDHRKLPKKGTASSIQNGNVVNNNFDAGIFNKQSASLTRDASRVQIKKDLVKTDAHAPRGQKKAQLSGSFITTGTATVEYSDATEEDCPYSAYQSRRSPGRKGQKWKYSEPGFKIDYRNLEILGNADESGSSISADWPQCMKVKIPIKFPPGTDLKKLAMGLAIYFPGCPRFVCAGRVCGLEFAAQAGTAVGEACWTDDLCKLKPVPANKKKDDIIGYAAENAETTACDRPFNGGTLQYEATICQHEDDRGKDYKACPLFNFAADESTLRKKIVVVARLYDKKATSGGGIFGGGGFNFGRITGAITGCDIKNFELEGCREMGMDYKISAFGLQGDDKKYTGIDRKSSGTSGGSTGGSTGGGGGGNKGGWGNLGNLWGNRGSGNSGSGGSGGGQSPQTTEATTTAAATTAATTSANRPWWQKNNWWNGKK